MIDDILIDPTLPYLVISIVIEITLQLTCKYFHGSRMIEF